METWLGFLAVGIVSVGSAAIFSRLIQTISRSPSDQIRTDVFGRADAVFVGLVIGGLGLLYVTSALMGGDKKPEITNDGIIASCILNLGVIGAILMFLGLRGINPLQVFGLTGVATPRKFLLGLGLLVCAYPLIILAQMISYAFTSPEARVQDVVTFLLNTDKWSERITVSVLAVVMAPMLEELIFRGYLYGVIRKYGGRVSAILITSLIFAAIHVHLPAMLALFVLAVVLCLAYERTGSLWVPIFMHATFNSVSVYLAVFHPSLAQ